MEVLPSIYGCECHWSNTKKSDFLTMFMNFNKSKLPTKDNTVTSPNSRKELEKKELSPTKTKNSSVGDEGATLNQEFPEKRDLKEKNVHGNQKKKELESGKVPMKNGEKDGSSPQPSRVSILSDKPKVSRDSWLSCMSPIGIENNGTSCFAIVASLVDQFEQWGGKCQPHGN